MRISRAIKITQQVRDEINAVLRLRSIGAAIAGNKNQSTVDGLNVLIELAKKINIRAPNHKKQSGMAVCTLVRSLLKAKNQKAPVQITDTEGSFTDDQIITVDETQDGAEVNIVLQYAKL